MNTDDDIRQTMRLTIPHELNWVQMPDRFPYDEWEDPVDWVDDMAATVFYVAHGKRDDLRPTPEWFIRTRKLIAAAWLSFAETKNFGKFLLFHSDEALPAHLLVDGFLGDLPWAEAQDIYFRAHHDEVVEGPHFQPFDMPGAEAAMKIVYYAEANLETHALAVHYTYAFRKDGMDIVVRALFAGLDLIREGGPVLDEFVRGIKLSFGDTASG